MKGAIGRTLMIASPFIAAFAIILAFKLYDKYAAWRYARAVKLRNANLVRHGLVPFRGTKKLSEPLL